MAGQRGFTYIEMLAIVAINVLIAFLIMPNLITQKANRDAWSFRSKLMSFAREARSTAIEMNDEVALGYDHSKNCIQIVQNHQNTSPVVLRELDVPDSITPEKFMADQNESPPDGWIVPFYPDGMTSGGGIQFGPDEHVFSFMIRRTTGEPVSQDSELPDLSQETWPAGSYAQRS